MSVPPPSTTETETDVPGSPTGQPGDAEPVASGGGPPAATGDSVLATAVKWVVGTRAGRATAVVAVIAVGVALVGVGRDGGPAGGSAIGDPAAVAGPGLPAPDEVSTAPTGTGSAGRSPGASGPSAVSDASGSPAGTGAPGASALPGPAGVPGPSGRASDPTPVPPATALPAGQATLEVGNAAPIRALRQGGGGEIAIPIRNTGSGPATGLTATVSLPAGLSARPGGADEPNQWRCTGTGRTATCRLSSLPATTAGTVRVRVSVSLLALPGTVGGEVTASDGTGSALREPIPPTLVAVLPI